MFETIQTLYAEVVPFREKIGAKIVLAAPAR
jgi:hypothetical protein